MLEWRSSMDADTMELMRHDKATVERMARLRAIRLKLHKIASQRQFAARLGISYNQYNNWEGVGTPIPLNEVKRIKDITPEVTGDYIAWGDTRGLTAEVLRKLLED